MDKLSKLKPGGDKPPYRFNMRWQSILTAPFNRDLQLAVIDASGIHALVFPCRRVLHGWIKSGTDELVVVRPTHWREWDGSVSSPFARPDS
jgi:hypothetical protein